MTGLIVALDVETLARQEELLDALEGLDAWYKVGLQLFTAAGGRAVEAVKRRGGKVFLDLKLHDIPQTVALAVREAGRLGADAASLHLMGGKDMLRAAADVPARPRLWGVTVLTSMTDEGLAGVWPGARAADMAASLAELGLSAGIDAVICSPADVPGLRRRLAPRSPRFVTPGVRPAGAERHDQARVTTPREAAALGIDRVVVGRPITHARDPRAAAEAILAELREGAR